jgi:hypothetical protein
LPTRKEGKKIDYCDLLSNIYRRVMAFEAKEYYFTEEADDKFVEIYNRCEIRRVNHHSGAMRAAWGKIAGRIAKYALNLHLEAAAVAGLDDPSSTISIAILDKATKRAMLDIQQLEANYCSQENEIASHFAKLISLSQRKGSISARDVSQSFSKDNRPNAPTVRQWFAELAAMGWGETDGTGIKVNFKAFNQQNKVDLQPTNNLQFLPTNQTLEDKEVQPFVGFVGKSLNIDRENERSDKDENVSTKPTNLQSEGNPLAPTVSTVGKNVDTKSTNLQSEDLEIGQTITITGGLHKDSLCTVLEIEAPSTNGETGIVLLKNNHPLAMSLSTLIRSGYRVETI